MPEVTFQGRVIQYSPYPYNYGSAEMNGHLINIKDQNPFWASAEFIHQCQLADVPMETIGDLNEFIKNCSIPSDIRSIMRNHFISKVGTIEEDGTIRNNGPRELTLDTVLFAEPGEHQVREDSRTRRGGRFLLADTPPTTEKMLIEGCRRAAVPTIFSFVKVLEVETGDTPVWMTQVQNWSWEPEEFIFLSHKRDYDPNLFFGIEFEISTALSCAEIQHIVTDVEPKQEPFFYFKSDTSITGEYGNLVEIVCYPMTPRRARQEWSVFFNKIEKLCRDKGRNVSDYFDTSACLNNGIHIHLSKDAFNPGIKGLNAHKKRFITSWNLWDTSTQEFYQRISKRMTTPRSNEYCQVHPDLDGLTLARRLMRGVPQSSRGTTNRRHSTCHETRNTVELRVFQGIFDKRHMLSCIDITLATFEFTKEVPLTYLNRHYTSKFISWISRRPGFKYAKEAIQCV